MKNRLVDEESDEEWIEWTDNGIKVEGARYLADVIRCNTTLKTLKLWSKNFEIFKKRKCVIQWILFRRRWCESKSYWIQLSWNSLWPWENKKTKYKMVWNDYNIVHMTENIIQPNGAILLCEALKHNSTLTELNLAGKNTIKSQWKTREDDFLFMDRKQNWKQRSKISLWSTPSWWLPIVKHWP